MSAPTPAPAPPEGRPLLPRLLVVVAFAAVGFVAIWQGFGAAGYGTDLHTKRVSWTCFQLLAGGFVAVALRGWFSVRVLVALVFFGSASHAWWEIRSSNFKSAISLGEAVAEQDQLRQRFAEPLQNAEHVKGTKVRLDQLADQYPSLAAGLRDDHARWVTRAEEELAEKFRQLSATDYATARELQEISLALRGPAGGQHEAVREWIQRARAERDAELRKVPPGDWAGFDRTAPGRQALVEAFGGLRGLLVVSEDAWVNRSVRAIVAGRKAQPLRQMCLALEKDVLALQSLNPDDGRFAAARQYLFQQAHEAVQREVTAHLEAGQYDRAFGVARAHAVEWSATATLLGEAEKLDQLREHCEALARLYEVSAKPAAPTDIAPPPRAKPD